MGAPKAYTPQQLFVDKDFDDSVSIQCAFHELDEALLLNDIGGSTLRKLLSSLGIKSERTWNDNHRRNAVADWVYNNVTTYPTIHWIREPDSKADYGDESHDGDDSDDDGSQDGEIYDHKSDTENKPESEGQGDGEGEGQPDDQPEVRIVIQQGAEVTSVDLETARSWFGGPSDAGSGPTPEEWWDGKLPEPNKEDGYKIQPPEGDERAEHYLMPVVLAQLAAGRHVYLWGEKGSGKSSAGIEYAKRVGLPLYPVSGHPHLMRGELVGAMLPTGPYYGPLVEAARDGISLIDEMDNTSPSAITQVNMLLANGFVAGPTGAEESHSSFRCVATANTNGNGATTRFVGRFKIDEATLDRFAKFEWNTDYALERYIVRRTLGLDLAIANEWLEICHQMRKNIESYGLQTGVSMRSTVDGAKTLAVQNSEGWEQTRLPRQSPMELAHIHVLNVLPEDQRVKVLTGL